MSGYRKHTLAAAGSGLFLLVALKHSTPITPVTLVEYSSYIIMSICGGLFPDIDIKSKGQQLLYALLIPLFAAALLSDRLVLTLLLAALGVMAPLLPHRGITHQLWFVITGPLIGPGLIYSYCPLWFPYSMYCYLFFSLGAISHLFLDFGFEYWIRNNKKARKNK